MPARALRDLGKAIVFYRQSTMCLGSGTLCLYRGDVMAIISSVVETEGRLNICGPGVVRQRF